MAKSVRRLPGVLAADINFASGLMVLEYEAGSDPRAGAAAAIVGAGHAVEPLEMGEQAPLVAPMPTWWSEHRAEVSVAASGVSIVLAWLAHIVGLETASIVLYATAIVVGSTLTWRRAAISLAAFTLDMNVLMTVAVCGAAALGEWGEGAMVVFLFALGGVLESRALARTRRSIRDLMSLAPEQARVLQGSGETLRPLNNVAPGERVVVRPGERVPLDGTIVRGDSSLDESPITGESVPLDKGPGDVVFAGTLNVTGRVEIEVTARATDSTLARIVHLVEVAQAGKAPIQRFVDRFSRWYTPAVMAGAVSIVTLLPLSGELGAPWAGFESWRGFAYQALVLLVVACPCALVISTPVSIVSAISRATREGVLTKGGAFLELAAHVRAVAFDKTGTLTEGRPAVERVVPLNGRSAADVIALAAALEAHSNHPVARAVAASVPPEDRPAATELREIAGRGVVGRVGDEQVVAGNLVLAEESGVVDEPLVRTAASLEDEGLTVVVVLHGADGSLTAAGVIGVADALRPECGDAVRELRRSGIEHIVMLTGDNERAAQRVAASAGIDEYRARLLPEGKTSAVRDLREAYGIVAMVGDGINDAPALASADIGIAMGAAGSDTAVEVADVALMRDDLAAVPRFFALGRRTMTIIRQNVALSIAVKFAVLALALSGYATLWMAVFADSGVALIVIANGLRLLREG